MRKRMGPIIVAGLLCLATPACVSIPDTYAPPMQRKPLTGYDPSSLRAYVNVTESGAEAHFVRDINLYVEGDGFRWTQQRPMFQFNPASRVNQRLKLEFRMNGEVIQKTGGITVSYYVNGKLLDKVRYDKEGEYVFEKPVPEAWLSVDSPTVVAAQLDKVMETPDGAKLGLVLTGAGFVD